MFTLFPISDIHLGNKTCDKAKLQRHLKDVGSKGLIVGIGDWLDMIIVKDAKRYKKDLDDSKSEAIVDEQIDEMYRIVSPYADRIIGIGDGNHEDSITATCGTNPIKRLCEKLSTPEHRVPYLGYSWLLRLIFHQAGEKTRHIIIRGHHGWGGSSRTEGADITKYAHDVKFWRADLFLYGHVHKLKINDVEEGRIVGEKQWATFLKRMVVCGTYQRTYSDSTTATYAEKKGFPPTSIRSPKIFIKPNHQWVDISVQH